MIIIVIIIRKLTSHSAQLKIGDELNSNLTRPGWIEGFEGYTREIKIQRPSEPERLSVEYITHGISLFIASGYATDKMYYSQR